MEKTFEELAKLKSGTILEDYYDEGVRVLIMRGPTALCCYFGIPESHPIAGFDYDSVSIDCHGGLTFSGAGRKDEEGKNIWPGGFYWYGFDYAHLGDVAFFDLDPEIQKIRAQYPKETEDKKWTVEMVKKDIWSALYDFKRLVALAEKIKAK